MNRTDQPETTYDMTSPPASIQQTDVLDQHVLASSAPEKQDEEDEFFATDPEVIFRREYSRLDTIPLRAAHQRNDDDESIPASVSLSFLLVFVGALACTLLGMLTAPSVTIILIPVSRHVSLTTQLAVPTRTLAPVTLSRAMSAPTTGHGHHAATLARGLLTFYNGQASSQSLPADTVVTGRNGIQVRTRFALTIPAANPPAFGEASVQASALRTGSVGNLPAGEVNGTLASALFVKNLAPFTGGSDARDFRAVAQADLDTLSATLKTTLAQQLPQAFPAQTGERVIPTACHVSLAADHTVGEEASVLTVQASETCAGVAYQQQDLEQQATDALTHETSPGAYYELLGTSAPQVVGLTPFTVQVSGTWVYVLPPTELHVLAQQITGDDRQEAAHYLLQTGVITRASIPAATLPGDPGHIHFLILLIGG